MNVKYLKCLSISVCEDMFAQGSGAVEVLAADGTRVSCACVRPAHVFHHALLVLVPFF